MAVLSVIITDMVFCAKCRSVIRGMVTTGPCPCARPKPMHHATWRWERFWPGALPRLFHPRVAERMRGWRY